MKITKDELLHTLDQCYDPYPAFSSPEQVKEHLEKLKAKIHPEFHDSDQTFAENIYDDIADDIQNCGRDPLAKFIEQIEPLIIIKHEDPKDFDLIIDYFIRMINDL